MAKTIAKRVTPKTATKRRPYVCVLNPKTWLRGEGSSNSYLLRRGDGKMCCMGQLALRCGVPAEDLLGEHEVEVDVIDKARSTAGRAILEEFAGNEFEEVIYRTNDGTDMPDATRVKLLNKHLRDAGMRFRFALPSAKRGRTKSGR